MTVMNGIESDEPLNRSDLERAIREKIDRIFEGGLQDYRFVRSNPKPDDKVPPKKIDTDLLGRIKAFKESLSEERWMMKTLLERLPKPSDTEAMSKDDMRRALERMKMVGMHLEPVLDRLLDDLERLIEEPAGN